MMMMTTMVMTDEQMHILICDLCFAMQNNPNKLLVVIFTVDEGFSKVQIVTYSVYCYLY